MKLRDQVAIVTGAGDGLGRGIATEFAREGANVLIADIDPKKGESTASLVSALGRKALAVQVDVSRSADVARMLDRCLKEFGRLDILVNNVGIADPVPFLELTEERWDRMLATNLTSCFLCTQAAARYWVREKRRGKVIIISSVEGVLPYPFHVHYGVSKAGMKMFTQAVSLALAPYQINVNDLGPGIFEDTGMTRERFKDPDYVGGIPVRVPWGRPGRPEEVGRAAVFLASSDADYITGASLYVDGAHMLGAPAQLQKLTGFKLQQPKSG